MGIVCTDFNRICLGVQVQCHVTYRLKRISTICYGMVRTMRQLSPPFRCAKHARRRRRKAGLKRMGKI
jgi:hypothetical protein